MIPKDKEPTLTLAYGLTLDDLYTREGLQALDAHFLEFLPPDLAVHVRRAREASPEGKEMTDLLLALAPEVEAFLAKLFAIEKENHALRERHASLAPLYQAKRLFIQRRAAKSTDAPSTEPPLPHDELEFAREVMAWLQDEETHKAELDEAMRYALWALKTPEGQTRHKSGILFRLPEKRDPANLVPFHKHEDGSLSGDEGNARDRHGFDLTDHGASLTEALAETNYCINCAHQLRDSCAKGLRDKKAEPFPFARDAHGTPLAGCPLEERISEFMELKSQGLSLAALAVICIDNPMVAATGHRICNDCVKACIYQKQTPVAIPQAETRTLKDVLSLPWGFEIYSLLTRWNPLNFARPLPMPESGRSVLVAGLGPAGYTLAHHLLQEGHHVFAVDGLKIEPLPEEVLRRPVYDVSTLHEKLSERIMAGFGGVAEYGITVRWDKNFLKLIRLLLERRAAFAYAGGVRMGGTLTLQDAFDAGFDHVALCLGAGKPHLLDIPNALARGVRMASDFLMALQLTGAAKADSLANLEMRLPIVVIGGGLTAIDTATEALAYYPLQVEKFLHRYETLDAEGRAEALRATWSVEERQTAETFLAHARALRQTKSVSERRALLQSWGGATVVYRKPITSAPSYRLNHEEITLALQEGIIILDNARALSVEVDAHKHVSGLRIQRPDEDERILPAGAILVAAGTQPNTALAQEEAMLQLDTQQLFFRAMDEQGNLVPPERHCKPAEVHIMATPDGRVSFLGDLHPSFAGNVVKAMASAKRGAAVITRSLQKSPPTEPDPRSVLDEMRRDLGATIEKVTRLTAGIVEITVKAPRAAHRFRAGQFYRLQNYESTAPKVEGTRLAMEGIALTGAEVYGDLVKLIVLETGGSSNLCARLKEGEPVVLMGPTGAPTEIPRGGETVLLVGGGLGNAVLFSIGQACRLRGNRVLYFAGYKKRSDRFKVREIEEAADQIIWCCDEEEGFTPSRKQDRAFTGNMLDALLEYAKNPQEGIPLHSIDRVICIGSDGLMAAIAEARRGQGVLAPYMNPLHMAIGSINSPMQCMMKGVCAQCLQRQRDPDTGEERVVFSCASQDQPLDHVDFPSLRQRLAQNSLSEKLTVAWLARCLEKMDA